MPQLAAYVRKHQVYRCDLVTQRWKQVYVYAHRYSYAYVPRVFRLESMMRPYASIPIHCSPTLYPALALRSDLTYEPGVRGNVGLYLTTNIRVKGLGTDQHRQKSLASLDSQIYRLAAFKHTQHASC